MKIKKMSFMTPITQISNNYVVLEKTYSRKFRLSTNETITVSSNVGRRDIQQDSVAISHNNGYLLLLVADGMGGMSDGEVASYNTAKIIKEWFESENGETLKMINKDTLENLLHALMYLISTTISNGSGSTLNMSIIGPDTTFIVNIGDSRAYTVKNGEITLRTKDDSMIFEMYHPKTEYEIDLLRFCKDSNIVTNAVMKDLLPIINITEIANDEYDILCHVTDGVTYYLDQHSINQFLKSSQSAMMLVEKSVYNVPIYNDRIRSNRYNRYIYSGLDNATAIVYTKKK